MGTNLPETAGFYKLTNEILDIKRNIILYEVPVDENLVPRPFHLWYGTSSRYKWHTFATVRYKKREMSWIRGWFHDKILAELLKNSSH